jgi:hypothetical protein
LASLLFFFAVGDAVEKVKTIFLKGSSAIRCCSSWQTSRSHRFFASVTGDDSDFDLSVVGGVWPNDDGRYAVKNSGHGGDSGGDGGGGGSRSSRKAGAATGHVLNAIYFESEAVAHVVAENIAQACFTATAALKEIRAAGGASNIPQTPHGNAECAREPHVFFRVSLSFPYWYDTCPGSKNGQLELSFSSSWAGQTFTGANRRKQVNRMDVRSHGRAIAWTCDCVDVRSHGRAIAWTCDRMDVLAE